MANGNGNGTMFNLFRIIISILTILIAGAVGWLYLAVIDLKLDQGAMRATLNLRIESATKDHIIVDRRLEKLEDNVRDLQIRLGREEFRNGGDIPRGNRVPLREAPSSPSFSR